MNDILFYVAGGVSHAELRHIIVRNERKGARLYSKKGAKKTSL